MPFQPKTNKKYVTNTSESDTIAYGYGIEHNHSHLSPTYQSVYEELLYNKLHCLNEE